MMLLCLGRKAGGRMSEADSGATIIMLVAEKLARWTEPRPGFEVRLLRLTEGS